VCEASGRVGCGSQIVVKVFKLCAPIGGKHPLAAATLTSGSFSGTRVGYVVGGGGEWMLSSNWSAKLEYLHYDLRSATYATGGLANNLEQASLQGSGTAAVATSSKVRFNDNIVRVGVNYHFN
ncbi:MAG TPA: hypothetical protein VK620_23850, partial [Bradyrhizobium sp.]|nr:hypothetical protein [Bradyrhizobium sp.]